MTADADDDDGSAGWVLDVECEGQRALYNVVLPAPGGDVAAAGAHNLIGNHDAALIRVPVLSEVSFLYALERNRDRSAAATAPVELHFIRGAPFIAAGGRVVEDRVPLAEGETMVAGPWSARLTRMPAHPVLGRAVRRAFFDGGPPVGELGVRPRQTAELVLFPTTFPHPCAMRALDLRGPSPTLCGVVVEHRAARRHGRERLSGGAIGHALRVRDPDGAPLAAVIAAAKEQGAHVDGELVQGMLAQLDGYVGLDALRSTVITWDGRTEVLGAPGFYTTMTWQDDARGRLAQAGLRASGVAAPPEALAAFVSRLFPRQATHARDVAEQALILTSNDWRC